MPLLTAQKHSWKNQPPNNFYHFPEEHKAGWKKFWESMDGDMDKIIDFAKSADIECPAEWFESLHRFLFDVFCGDPKILKCAAEKGFKEFLGQVIKNHKEKPKEKAWYVKQCITPEKFIGVLERAAEITDVRQAVALINAHMKDLGFGLYSEFILSKTKAKSEIKSVASDLNKKAYVLECEALGESPISGLHEGNVIGHSLHSKDYFMVTEVVHDDKDNIEMVVARDEHGHVAFIKDLWNVYVK